MYTATCLCGSCHITIDSVVGTGLCHCITCRKMSSSAFTINTVIRDSDFHLKRGTPKTCILTADSGTKSTLNYCGDCGSALWMDWPGMPEVRILKGGILDGDDIWEREDLKPKAEQFTNRRPSWLCAVAGIRQCEGQQDLGKLKV